MIYARITGTGSYLPEKKLSNRDLEAMVETSDEWIFSRTGIRSRHIAAENETTSDLALAASQRAISAAGIDPYAAAVSDVTCWSSLPLRSA